MFLTKGMDVANQEDIKMIENDKCYICRWNEIKLKKIIEENCLAKDHLQALKHLIAN
jgi:predicted methyltransferase